MRWLQVKYVVELWWSLFEVLFHNVIIQLNSFINYSFLEILVFFIFSPYLGIGGFLGFRADFHLE